MRSSFSAVGQSEQVGLPYVLATRSTDTVATVDWRQRRVRALIAEVAAEAWQRCSAGAGAHGLRLDGWARVELLAGFDPDWSCWVRPDAAFRRPRRRRRSWPAPSAPARPTPRSSGSSPWPAPGGPSRSAFGRPRTR